MESTKTEHKDDLFLDDEFAPLDTRDDRTFSEQLEDLAKETEEPAETGEVESAVEVPETKPKVVEPEVVNLKDVGVLTITRTKKGWQGVVDALDGSNPNVFYGATKEEMYQNIAVSKVHGDRKIREQNRTIKLGSPATQKPKPVEALPAKELTADEIFEIKTQLQSDPNLALKTWFQKATGGMTLEELVSLARDGQAAKADLENEAVARAFVAANPEYYADPQNVNVSSIVTYLFKDKLHEAVPSGMDIPEAISALQSKGFWTVRFLTEAYLDLDEAGLLVKSPAKDAVKSEPEVVESVEPAPTKPPADERIARTIRRPRAGLGIRQSDASASVTKTDQKPPSVEELDDLSPEQLNALMKSVVQERIRTRR